jgi:hypothetical protein
VFPGPAGRGGVGLAGVRYVWVPGCGQERGPALATEELLISFSERAAVRPLHAKAFYGIHRVAKDKDLLWNVMNREIKKVKTVLRNVLYSFPGYFTYSFADFV